jgi:hypothetical protein
MNFSNSKNMQILALLIFVVSIKLFIDHRKNGYNGEHRINGDYDKITPVKHDVFKAFWVDFFIMLVLGLGSGELFYDPANLLGSWLGKTLVGVSAYLTYYELLEPYVVNKLPSW